jgi:protein MAK11
MLSGGQDGTICIWDAKRWECLVTLKAHKYPLLCGHSTRLEMAANSFLTSVVSISSCRGGVIDFSVHPSGKVALSIGKDKSMKMWDLVLGKSAFKSRLVRGELLP